MNFDERGGICVKSKTEKVYWNDDRWFIHTKTDGRSIERV